MPGVTIDRLSLRLSGLSEDDSRRLARLIAEGLAATSLPAGGGHADSVQSKVTPGVGANLQSLSEQVVADVVRQLVRQLERTL